MEMTIRNCFVAYKIILHSYELHDTKFNTCTREELRTKPDFINTNLKVIGSKNNPSTKAKSRVEDTSNNDEPHHIGGTPL